MNTWLELYHTIQHFNSLCRERSCLPDIEKGNWVIYKGQKHVVVDVDEHALLLLDEDLTRDENMPLLTVPEWENNDTVLVLPELDMLIEWIYNETGHYPTMLPGVAEGTPVWQVSIPNMEKLVAESLDEALLDIAVETMQKQD